MAVDKVDRFRGRDADIHGCPHSCPHSLYAKPLRSNLYTSDVFTCMALWHSNIHTNPGTHVWLW